jgi:hypothetical protein
MDSGEAANGGERAPATGRGARREVGDVALCLLVPGRRRSNSGSDGGGRIDGSSRSAAMGGGEAANGGERSRARQRRTEGRDERGATSHCAFLCQGSQKFREEQTCKLRPKKGDGMGGRATLPSSTRAEWPSGQGDYTHKLLSSNGMPWGARIESETQRLAPCL